MFFYNIPKGKVLYMNYVNETKRTYSSRAQLFLIAISTSVVAVSAKCTSAPW